MKQHYGTEIRKQNLLRFYNYVKKYKDKYSLTQICSLFALETGISNFTVNDYKAVYMNSGVMKVEGDRVTELIDIEKK